MEVVFWDFRDIVFGLLGFFFVVGFFKRRRTVWSEDEGFGFFGLVRDFGLFL